MKYIVVTGGVVSGLGKGITISSIGRILKSSGLRVTSIKIDPYLNVDAGTMSPFEHGETFVLDDGGETDLDLGNYERFLDITLTGKHNITSGKVYEAVINQERRGDYLGKTVQIVPHATDMVQRWLKEVAMVSVDGTGVEPDVCLIEVGGTVGDIESMVFLEALRQFQFLAGRENMVFVHVSLVPVLGPNGTGEQKTKPTQHSVKELRALGLSPDIIVCRSDKMLEPSTKAKISTFCHVTPDCIISVHNVSNVYHVPLILAQQGVHTIIKQRLNIAHMRPEPDLSSWSNLAHTVDNYSSSVEVAVVGKYVGSEDAYLSVVKALQHAAMHLNVNIKIKWVESSHLDAETLQTEPDKHATAWDTLKHPNIRGIIVPGGFGVRGVEGKIAAIHHARVNKIPFLGLCLGMQVMVIEYARNVLHMSDANSQEFDSATSHPVVVFMPEVNPLVMGGTMRLGARNTLISTRIDVPYPVAVPLSVTDAAVSESSDVNGNTTSTAAPTTTSTSAAAPCTPVSKHKPSTTHSSTTPTTTSKVGVDHGRSLASEVYGFQNSTDTLVTISERHRHRYEVNPAMVAQLEGAGLLFTGRDDKGERMEIVELSRDVHPHFLGTQYHPELKSRPTRPSPPFLSFAAVVCGQPEHLSKAGNMWREYDQGKKKEIAWIYSPKSGLKKRPVSALCSPAASASGCAGAGSVGQEDCQDECEEGVRKEGRVDE